jgi:hypothetical protein
LTVIDSSDRLAFRFHDSVSYSKTPYLSTPGLRKS